MTVNSAGTVYATWNFNNNTGGTPPSITVAGKATYDRLFFGALAYTSPASYLDFAAQGDSRHGRWGDYSSVVVDPLDSTRVWGVNEAITNQSTWVTSIFRFHR